MAYKDTGGNMDPSSQQANRIEFRTPDTHRLVRHRRLEASVR